MPIRRFFRRGARKGAKIVRTAKAASGGARAGAKAGGRARSAGRRIKSYLGSPQGARTLGVASGIGLLFGAHKVGGHFNKKLIEREVEANVKRGRLKLKKGETIKSVSNNIARGVNTNFLSRYLVGRAGSTGLRLATSGPRSKFNKSKSKSKSKGKKMRKRG